MTILTLNIWCGRRSAELLEFLTRQSAAVDVFCFQEIYSGSIPVTSERHGCHHPDDAQDIFERIQDILPNFRGLMAVKQDNYGNAMFVRNTLPIRGQQIHYLYRWQGAMEAGNPSTHGVNLLEVTVTTNRGPIRILTTHGYWEKDEGEDKPPRDQQISKILELIDADPAPVVLCGDFNMNTRTKGIARLTERLRNCGKEAGYATTRPAFSAYHGTVADYLFTSPELKVEQFEVLPDVVSDHLALRTTVNQA